MLRLISPRDMQACEKHYFETSLVPSIDIMENAARALADTVLSRFPGAKNVYIACGPGGNGGDGYACARLLKEKGLECTVFATAPAKSADAIENARRAAECGIEIFAGKLPENAPDLWIDCIYGTGLNKAPEGFALDLLCRIHYDHFRGTGVIACDIPSGLNGQTGIAYPGCVPSDFTVTFQLPKYGLYLQDGLDRCGEIIAADVGFPGEAFPESLYCLIQKNDLKYAVPKRWKRNIHKGSCGHLLIIAGSFGMAGAAALCAKAALRSGVGLVSIACPGSIVTIHQTLAPCAMCIPLPEESGAISADALPLIQDALKNKTAAAIGPGLTQRVPEEIIRCVLESGIPAVIDADALNIIAKSEELRSLLSVNHILTPHPGEAARLIGRRIEDPIADTQKIAALGATVVLKGASRVIAGRKSVYISASGANGMARGGSGDIFTGILGALLAACGAKEAAYAAVLPMLAAAACEIHGLAGELAQEKYGAHAMNSADIIEFLPEVFKTYVE
ncbi:MAG: NAD(P)H-hydrate dehydratase [Clostridia bacterium]|nr:NAD(P)H-hydrate dehydratase [Clostridia bacterium]